MSAEAIVATVVALGGAATWGTKIVWQLAQIVSEVKGMRAELRRADEQLIALHNRVDRHHDRIGAVEHTVLDHDRRLNNLED